MNQKNTNSTYPILVKHASPDDSRVPKILEESCDMLKSSSLRMDKDSTHSDYERSHEKKRHSQKSRDIPSNGFLLPNIQRKEQFVVELLLSNNVLRRFRHNLMLI